MKERIMSMKKKDQIMRCDNISYAETADSCFQ